MMECPYCRLLIGSEAAVVCPRCGTPHHLVCWKELDGCASEGCPGMIHTKGADTPAAYWGATEKRCPYCAEDIPVAETKCPKCGAEFAGMRPMDVDDVLPQLPDPAVRSCRKAARWLLFFSVLTPTSPFALLFGAFWYRSNRAGIERAGRDVRAMVLVSFGISGLYLAMALLGTVVFQLSPHGTP